MHTRNIEPHEVDNLFKYLDVQISEEDQKLFKKKLLQAQHITKEQLDSGTADLSAFKLMPESIVKSFMKRDYQDTWFDDALQNDPILKGAFVMIDGKKELTDEQKNVAKTKVRQKYIKDNFQNHLDQIKAGDQPAIDKRNNLLLIHQAKVAQKTDKPDVDKYLKSQAEQYQKQAAIFSRLNILIARVEGFHDCKKPDVRRWAKYIALAEDKESHELLGMLKIGHRSEEFAESLEEHGELVASVLMGIGIAVSTAGMVIAALHGEGKLDETIVDFGRNNDFGDNPLIEINEGAIGLTTGLVALLNGDTKAAMINISAGVLNLAATSVKLAADLGPHFLAFAHHIPIVNFAAIALSGGIAAYQHHQMRKVENTVVQIEDRIENLSQIQKTLKAQDKQETLIQSMLEIANELTADPPLDAEKKLAKLEEVDTIGSKLKERLTEIDSELNALKYDIDDKFELPDTREALKALREEMNSDSGKKIHQKTAEEREKLTAIERALQNLDISEVLEEQKSRISKAISLSEKVVFNHPNVAESKKELEKMDLPKTASLKENIQEEKSVLELAAQSKRQEAASIRKNRNTTFKAMAFLAGMSVLSIVGFALAATPVGWAIAGAGLAIGIALAGAGIYKRYQEKKEAPENKQRQEKIMLKVATLEEESSIIENKTGIDINKRFSVGDKPSMSFKTYIEEQTRKNPKKAEKIVEAFEKFCSDPSEDNKQNLKEAMSEKENKFDIFSKPIGEKLFEEIEKDLQEDEGEHESIHI